MLRQKTRSKTRHRRGSRFFKNGFKRKTVKVNVFVFDAAKVHPASLRLGHPASNA